MIASNKPVVGQVLILQDTSGVRSVKVGQPWEVLEVDQSSIGSWMVYVTNRELEISTWFYDQRFRDGTGRLCCKRKCVFNG